MVMFIAVDKNTRGYRRYLTGFTFLELMLSIAITGIVLLVLYSSFSLGLRVLERVDDKMDQDAREILSQLSRDLRSAYLSVDKGSNIGFMGTVSILNFITVAPLGDNLFDDGEIDLREVGYRLESYPDNNSYSLVYRVDLTLDDDALGGGESKQLSNMVRALKFAYYDGKDWKESWSSTEQLPQAVKVFLAFEPHIRSLGKDEFSTIVDIP